VIRRRSREGPQVAGGAQIIRRRIVYPHEVEHVLNGTAKAGKAWPQWKKQHGDQTELHREAEFSYAHRSNRAFGTRGWGADTSWSGAQLGCVLLSFTLSCAGALVFHLPYHFTLQPCIPIYCRNLAATGSIDRAIFLSKCRRHDRPGYIRARHMDAENPHMLSDYSRHTDVSTSNFVHMKPSTTDTVPGIFVAEQCMTRNGC